MSSSNISTISMDFFRVYPFLSATASTMWALVREPDNGLVGASFRSETSNYRQEIEFVNKKYEHPVMIARYHYAKELEYMVFIC